jgi:hypothetical protein
MALALPRVKVRQRDIIERHREPAAAAAQAKAGVLELLTVQQCAFNSFNNRIGIRYTFV